MGYSDHAGVILQFIVVGGGISGLASAYALARAGHEVLLIEKGDGKPRSIGGLRSPPNMTKLLTKWGLGPTLDKIARHCQSINFISGESGDKIGTMVMHDELIRDLVAGFLFIKHADLHDLLYQLAEQEGVSFRFNSRVASFDPQNSCVVLDNGARHHGDIFIGADGYENVLGRYMLAPAPESIENHLVVTFTVRAQELMEDEDLRSLTDDPSSWTFWLGEDHVAHAHVLDDDCNEYTVTIIHNYKGPTTDANKMDWSSNRDINSCGIDFSKLELRAHKLLRLGKNRMTRVASVRPTLDALVCEDSRIILVGDAGTPLPPGTHHSAAIALEDAETLGSIFSRISNRSQLPQLFTAYDEIRQPRCRFVQSYNVLYQALLKAPKGAYQERRDARLRKTLVQEDGGTLGTTFMDVWGGEIVIFTYDATEKVEDWWSQFGQVIVKNSNRHSILSGMRISVSKDLVV